MILQDGKATLELPATPEASPRLTEWLETLLGEIDFPLKASQQIMICTDEIAANVAAYAYPPGTSGNLSVSVEFNAASNELTMIFSDSGIPFDPLRHEAPDTSAPLEERAVGGLGILIVQRMMDRVAYRRDADRNVLTLVKCGGKS